MFWYHLNFEELRWPRRCPPLELTYHLQNRTYTKSGKKQASKRKNTNRQQRSRFQQHQNRKKERSHKNIRKITQEHCYCFAPDEEEGDGAGWLISPYSLNGSKRHTCAHNYHKNVNNIIFLNFFFATDFSQQPRTPSSHIKLSSVAFLLALSSASTTPGRISRSSNKHCKAACTRRQAYIGTHANSTSLFCDDVAKVAMINSKI